MDRKRINRWSWVPSKSQSTSDGAGTAATRSEIPCLARIRAAFTPAVRELQEILSRRLLAQAWLADESAFSNVKQRETWVERIRTHFSETTGRIGFPEAPIEGGDRLADNRFATPFAMVNFRRPCPSKLRARFPMTRSSG